VVEKLSRGLGELIRQNEARAELPFLNQKIPEGTSERTTWVIEKLGEGIIANSSDDESVINITKGVILTVRGNSWELDAKGTIKQPLPIVPSDLRFIGEIIEPIDGRRRSFRLHFNMWSQDIERLIRRLIEHKKIGDGHIK